MLISNEYILQNVSIGGLKSSLSYVVYPDQSRMYITYTKLRPILWDAQFYMFAILWSDAKETLL
jgi:hypothetical protein